MRFTSWSNSAKCIDYIIHIVPVEKMFPFRALAVFMGICDKGHSHLHGEEECLPQWKRLLKLKVRCTPVFRATGGEWSRWWGVLLLDMAPSVLRQQQSDADVKSGWPLNTAGGLDRILLFFYHQHPPHLHHQTQSNKAKQG